MTVLEPRGHPHDGDGSLDGAPFIAATNICLCSCGALWRRGTHELSSLPSRATITASTTTNNNDENNLKKDTRELLASRVIGVLTITLSGL